MAFEFTDLSRKVWKSISTSDARINLWEGAVRSGKTIASIIRWLEYVKTAPPGELVMIGKTERTLKRNILDVIESMIGTKNFKYKVGAGEIWLAGRRIYVVGANDERAEGKIRGGTYAGAYGDELTLWPESFWTMLLSRLSVKGAKAFGTTNPDSPYHFLKTDFIDKEGLNLKTFHFDITDNPALDPEYVKALMNEYTGLWYKRFILGLWVLAEGAIYDMWDEDKHVRPSPGFLTNRIAAVDYGTTNPCTFGMYAWNEPSIYDRNKKKVIQLETEYWWDSKAKGRQKTDAQYADDFVAWCSGIVPEVVYVDPSAASFILELRKRGYFVEKANNDVIDGIQFISNLLNTGCYFVDPSCKATIKEFGAYVWDAKAEKKGLDQPLKTNDHTRDRDRYALYSHFGQDCCWVDTPGWL